MPHNRFEYPHFSKQLVAIDPGSYHRLGLALTDSYVRAETEIDGKIPGYENKLSLDEDDIELLNLASSLENISKKICKSANRLSYKKIENDSRELISLDFSENVLLYILIILTERPSWLLTYTLTPKTFFRIRYLQKHCEKNSQNRKSHFFEIFWIMEV